MNNVRIRTVVCSLMCLLTSCSGSFSYDREMYRLVNETGPKKLEEAKKAYVYCAETLRKDQIIPQSMYLGSCSSLEIMIIQNTIITGNPWEIKKEFEQSATEHGDFNRWRAMYAKMADPYVADFCANRSDKSECLSVLNDELR